MLYGDEAGAVEDRPGALNDRRGGRRITHRVFGPVLVAGQVQAAIVFEAVHDPVTAKCRAQDLYQRAGFVDDLPAVDATHPTPQIRLRREDLATGTAQGGERPEPFDRMPQTLNQPRSEADDAALGAAPGCEVAEDRNRVPIGNRGKLQVTGVARNRRENAGLRNVHEKRSKRRAGTLLRGMIGADAEPQDKMQGALKSQGALDPTKGRGQLEIPE